MKKWKATLLASSGIIPVGIVAPDAVAPNPVPTISALVPDALTVGSGVQSVEVDGTNFIPASSVRMNGTAVTTTLVDATHLTATIPSTMVAIGGAKNVTVTNPSPAGGTTAPLTLTVA